MDHDPSNGPIDFAVNDHQRALRAAFAKGWFARERETQKGKELIDEEIERMSQEAIWSEVRERDPEDVNAHDPETHETRVMVGSFPVERWFQTSGGKNEFSEQYHRGLFAAALRYVRDKGYPLPSSTAALVEAGKALSEKADSLWYLFKSPDTEPDRLMRAFEELAAAQRAWAEANGGKWTTNEDAVRKRAEERDLAEYERLQKKFGGRRLS